MTTLFLLSYNSIKQQEKWRIGLENKTQAQKRLIGGILAVTGAILWGIQGPVSQFLFQDNNISPEWLMGIKMGISGIVILLFTNFVKKEPVMDLWRKPKNLGVFAAYAVFGLAAVQYLYLVTVNLSNAGTATVLQSLGSNLHTSTNCRTIVSVSGSNSNDATGKPIETFFNTSGCRMGNVSRWNYLYYRSSFLGGCSKVNIRNSIRSRIYRLLWNDDVIYLFHQQFEICFTYSCRDA